MRLGSWPRMRSQVLARSSRGSRAFTIAASDGRGVGLVSTQLLTRNSGADAGPASARSEFEPRRDPMRRSYIAAPHGGDQVAGMLGASETVRADRRRLHPVPRDQWSVGQVLLG